MREILKMLLIIQEVSNKGRKKKLGKGFSVAYRFNPFNPLSYIFLPLFLIVGIVMFGFVGVWSECDLNNPFKWR